jgi:putative membrane protein
VTGATPDPLAPDEGWNRLHPLTPIARVGRLAPALVLLLVVSQVHSKAENGRAETDYLIAITLISAVYGYIHWMVTRWRLEADTLRIETGLIRKDSRRLPLARIQAVDIVRPFLARLLGVSELRIRLAGSGSTDGKLA